MNAKTERMPTLGEEIANAISHGFGAVSALAASPFLLVAASARGGALAVTSASIYCTSLALLYLSSTLYHALPQGRAKRVFQIFDHSAIFVLIAGTYTPFALGALRGAWGWSVLAAVWSLAVVGIVVEAIGWRYRHIVSMALYLIMGWLALPAMRPIIERVATPGIILLVIGGVTYTLGVGFYALKKVRYAHLVWHLFVLAGSAIHFVAVMLYAA
ncbi:MAG: hemolysin III family protein [Acidobacteriota bacterium]